MILGNHFSPYTLRKGLWLNLRLTNLTSLGSQILLGVVPFHLHSNGITGLPVIHVGAGDANSGSHARVASTLPAEPHSQPVSVF